MAKFKARLDITSDPPIIVNSRRCDLCGICIGVCPADCIMMTEHSLWIVGKDCIRCGLCLPVCPVSALKWNDPAESESELDEIYAAA